MNEQLTIGDILNFVDELKKAGMTLSQIKKLPVYLGRDDELNGIHTGWCINYISENMKDDEDAQFMIELIGEDRLNKPFNKHAVVIS